MFAIVNHMNVLHLLGLIRSWPCAEMPQRSKCGGELNQIERNGGFVNAFEFKFLHVRWSIQWLNRFVDSNEGWGCP